MQPMNSPSFSAQRWRDLPLRVQAWRVGWRLVVWVAWGALITESEVQSGELPQEQVLLPAYLMLLVLGYVVPWYGSAALFRALNWRLPVRAVALLALAVVWAAVLAWAVTWAGTPTSLADACTATVTSVLVSVGVSELYRGWDQRWRLARVEQLRAESEQLLLGSQLAPHTLFNLLNTLYAVALTRPAELRTLVSELKTMMELLGAEAPPNFHPAHREWGFIEAYRNFALARVDERSQIRLQFDGEAGNPVPAFLAATLFENALKHGMDESGRVDVYVGFQVRADGFALEMRNGLPSLPAPESAQGLHAGLELVRQRLQYLYPYRHRFSARPDGGQFLVSMEAW
jgi:hypothetical protein